ncbi:MAG TPA: succinate dehydrogenase, hydrophobic membrane anchor protein [Gammaproteobacteria bacterium]|nr:succinate dehydrogenase, hydrophobic membrane anchor protein [Gammaproteobacteria bacterium]
MSRRAAGLRAWLLQRISAVYLALYVVYFLLASPAAGGAAAWRAWLGSPWPLLAMALFFLALSIHAWVGVRDVIIDYVHPAGLRLLLLCGLGVVLLGSLLWALLALAEVA